MTLSRSMLITLACIGALSACSSEPSKSTMESGVATPGDQGKAHAPARSADVPQVKSPAPSKMAESPSQRAIYFDFDESLIKKQYDDLVLKHSRYLVENPQRSVRLEGNADERGSREYNLALGNQRAEVVKRSLMLLGVPEKRIETVSFGEEKPRATGHDDVSWAENRRVDFVYRP